MDWAVTGSRCAGVSSFGFSGTNSHVNLQAAWSALSWGFSQQTSYCNSPFPWPGDSNISNWLQDTAPDASHQNS